MQSPQDVQQYVRLTKDIPELGLRCGQVGVVCSEWFAPTKAFEVEFQPQGLDYKTRALLLSDQIQSAMAAG